MPETGDGRRTTGTGDGRRTTGTGGGRRTTGTGGGRRATAEPPGCVSLSEMNIPRVLPSPVPRPPSPAVSAAPRHDLGALHVVKARCRWPDPRRRHGVHVVVELVERVLEVRIVTHPRPNLDQASVRRLHEMTMRRDVRELRIRLARCNRDENRGHASEDTDSQALFHVLPPGRNAMKACGALTYRAAHEPRQTATVTVPTPLGHERLERGDCFGESR